MRRRPGGAPKPSAPRLPLRAPRVRPRIQGNAFLRYCGGNVARNGWRDGRLDGRVTFVTGGSQLQGRSAEIGANRVPEFCDSLLLEIFEHNPQAAAPPPARQSERGRPTHGERCDRRERDESLPSFPGKRHEALHGSEPPRVEPSAAFRATLNPGRNVTLNRAGRTRAPQPSPPAV